MSPQTQTSNFWFIQEVAPRVYEYSHKAEQYLSDDPQTACFYARVAVEELIHRIFENLQLEPPPLSKKHVPLSAYRSDKQFIAFVRQSKGDILNKINLVSESGNKAAHPNAPISKNSALFILQTLLDIVYWAAYYDAIGHNIPCPPKDVELDQNIVVPLKRLNDVARDRLVQDHDAEMRAYDSRVHDLIAFHVTHEAKLEAENQRLAAKLAEVTAKAKTDHRNYHEKETAQALERALAGDFSDWRLHLLNKQQETIATRQHKGSSTLSGAAGTGKTQILLHRAIHLANTYPDAKILLVTFSSTLWKQLKRDLEHHAKTSETLFKSPDIYEFPRLVDFKQAKLKPGIYVSSIDKISTQLATAAMSNSDFPWQVAKAKVLGDRNIAIYLSRIQIGSGQRLWAKIANSIRLPKDIAGHGKFLEDEYNYIILPNALNCSDYINPNVTSRQGRKTPLTREQRELVWGAVTAYRNDQSTNAVLDWEESAMVVAEYLNICSSQGIPRLFNNILVDEGQDMSPSKLRLIRALAAGGPNDITIAEDSEQRIFGRSVTLSQYGIKVIGGATTRKVLNRNYRNTKQILDYARKIVEGGERSDLLGERIEGSPVTWREGKAVREVTVIPQLVAVEYITEQIVEWISQQPVVKSPIAVLVHDKKSATEIERNLSATLAPSNIPVVYLGNNSEREKVSKSILVMTMHRAKGEEFGRVVVDATSDDWGIDALSLPDAEKIESEERDRSTLYAAMTRARDELVVLVSSKRNPLLPPVESLDTLGVKREVYHPYRPPDIENWNYFSQIDF